jgi:MEMO1 family protein
MASVSHVSPFSGSWYPEDPDDLLELICGLFARSEERTGRYLAKPVGLVVPHAGIVYSGAVAAAAYRHLQRHRPDRVVLLGFAHRGSPPGVWIPEVRAIRTPLGDSTVDAGAAAELLKDGGFRAMRESVLCDHSIEIQLPFLQYAAPGARLLPVYVSHLSTEARAAAAGRLAELAGPGTVFVASSDFTHFGRSFSYQPFPVDRRTGDRLQDLDERTIDHASSLRPEMFLGSLRTTGSTVCGSEPIALLLETMRRIESSGDEIFQETLDYQTSGEITGDFHHSVSYAALGYFPFRSFELSAEDGALLVESARQTLARYLETGEREPVRPGRAPEALERRAAAFVTLHAGGELRGCVGRRGTGEPLTDSVPALTLAAALEDSRFEPVRRGDAGLDIEVSVLSPAKRIPDPSAFLVNTHGAIVETEFARGLLLPQVAPEHGWNAAQFLEALARKAGLSPRAMSDPAASLHVFRAQILG